MTLAAAQTLAHRGDIAANIQSHLQHIDRANKHRSQLILFPELSLTGYEPTLAADLGIQLEDKRLAVFQEKADQFQMIIIVGAPVREASNLYIGAIVFSPNQPRQLYTKQYLHPGEEKYFDSKPCDLQLNFIDEKINIAICADLTEPAHARDAAAQNCSLYLASVLVSVQGLDHDRTLLRQYAKNYQMTVLFSNYVGTSGGYDCGAHTSLWSKNGELQREIKNNQPGLLIAQRVNGKWATKIDLA